MSGRYTVSPFGRSAAEPNTRTSTVRTAMPFSRGMQPPPNDPRRLRKEVFRLDWAIHCLLGSRATVVILLDRKDRQLIQLRRERDAYAMALQDMAPELFALCEEERRQFDDPIKALKWASRTEFGDEWGDR